MLFSFRLFAAASSFVVILHLSEVVLRHLEVSVWFPFGAVPSAQQISSLIDGNRSRQTSVKLRAVNGFKLFLVPLRLFPFVTVNKNLCLPMGPFRNPSLHLCDHPLHVQRMHWAKSLYNTVKSKTLDTTTLK